MRLTKRALAVLVGLAIVVSSTGVFAAYDPTYGQTAAERMAKLKLVTGTLRDDGTVDMALGAEITRAQLVTIIVRAFGREAEAAFMRGAAAFPDTATHWASGNIAMAKALVEKSGDAIGMADGTFNPDGKVTPAQAVAFLMKFLGVKADPGKTWPANFLDKAVEIGLISAEDKALIVSVQNDNATRGMVFFLFDQAFYGYKLPNGKTFYTTYVDPIPPGLEIDAYDKETEATEVKLSGSAKDATLLWVNSQPQKVPASGVWQATVPLKVGANEVTVTAVDAAGNKVSKTAAITRKAALDAAIPASVSASARDAYVAAGTSTPVTIVVKDKDGKVIPDADYSVEVKGGIGTFDKAKGLFTAGSQPGQGIIIVTAGDAIPAVIPIDVTHQRRRIRLRKVVRK